MIRSAIALAAAFGLLLAPSTPAEAAPPTLPERLVLELASPDDPAAIVARLSDQLGVPLRYARPSIPGWSLVHVEAGHPLGQSGLETLAARLEARPEVTAVSVDRRIEPAVVPNDPGWSNQWWGDLINLPAAWDRSTGSSSVVIAIIDTGMVSHEDLNAGVVGGYDFVSDSWMANDGGGRDSDYTDPGDAADCGQGWVDSSWHGTMVAGAAAARGNNGIGLAGPAWSSSILVSRVMGRCGGSSVDIIEGTWWAGGGAISGVPNNSNPASVLNLSLGSLGSCDSYSQDVFDAINSWGVAVVSAAGNDGTNNAVSWPGDCDHVLDVAAHGHEDFLACYSNYGPTVDLVAPGGDIDFYGAQEAGIYTSSGPSSSSYSWPQGTSLAAPIVSGVVAQILALQPGWTLAQIQSHLQSHGRTAYCWNGGAPGWDNCSSDSGWAACPQAGLDAGAAMTALEGSSDDDSYEQNDSHSQAASVSCPSTINGQAEDDDWYSFQVNSGQDVEAELTWSGGADLDLALVDSSGEYEDVSDQGDTTSEQVSGSGLDGGSWYLLVAPYEGTASYSLSISCEEGSGDDDDNDDDDSGDDDDDGGGGGGGGRRRTACAAHGSPAHGASVLLLVLLALGCARLGTARSTNRRIF